MANSAHPGRPSAIVVGAGVAGLTAAYLLRHSHDVTLIEADDRLGGHAHTHRITRSEGDLQIDSGFIVHNRRTYPLLTRLFRELGVATQPTEMSMSISCAGCGLSYAGGRGLRGIAAQPTRLADPRFARLLTEVPRFHRAARALLARTAPAEPGPTWGEFLEAQRFSAYFQQHFAVPLVACVWSSGDADASRYPARHLFEFLDNHGMLQVTGSPTWRTVTGGSATYVARIAALLPRVLTGEPVVAVVRHGDGVEVRTVHRTLGADRVVLACHADQAAAVLADAEPAEKQALQSIRYSTNVAWLHRDSSVLPGGSPRLERAARASWNYRMPDCAPAARGVLVSYWANRLQRLPGADHLVTLNPHGWVDPAAVVAEMTYQHPIFTHEAVAAAAELRTAGGPRLAFAGAHLGWGFHEDGARSGVAAAQRFGATW